MATTVATAAKDPGALKTIGELSHELGIAQHILRYWETRFPQLRPMQRAGNRRYYRPADVALTRRIHRLLNHEGYTVRGVQKLLQAKSGGESEISQAVSPAIPLPAESVSEVAPTQGGGVQVERLIELRNRLSAALEN